MLSVTLKVKGEVLRPFTIGVSPVAFHIPSAQGTYTKKDPPCRTVDTDVYVCNYSYNTGKVAIQINC